jgi:hypothetical protein
MNAAFRRSSCNILLSQTEYRAMPSSFTQELFHLFA